MQSVKSRRDERDEAIHRRRRKRVEQTLNDNRDKENQREKQCEDR